MADFRLYSAYRTPHATPEGYCFDLGVQDKMTYPMDEQIKNAIELCLRNMKYPLNFIDDYARPGYEVYAEIFKTAEVIPYFFTYRQTVGSIASSNLEGSTNALMTPVIGTWGNINNSMDNLSTAPSCVWHEPFETWLGIEPRMSYAQSTRLAGSKKLGWKPLRHKNAPGILSYAQDLLYKTWTPSLYKSNFGVLPEGVDPFVGYIHTTNILGRLSTEKISEIENISDLYSNNLTKEKINADSYAISNPDLKLLKWTAFFANNEDGSYSTSAQRNKIMSVVRDNVLTNSKSGGIGGLYFAVKTTCPYAADSLGNIDSSVEGVQYWVFNAISLISTAFESISESANVYPIGVGVNSNDFDATFERQHISLPVMDSSGENNNGNIIPPFPYFIWKYTDYFNDENTKCLSITYSDGYDLPQPLKTGLALATNDVENFKRFYYYGLGIKVETDYEKVKSLNTSNWTTPEPPTPQGPTEEPGSGGQPAVTPSGGTGTGGGKDGGDAITPQSTQTGGGRISNQWAMTGNAVAALQECLVNDNIWDAVKTLFKSDYKQGMINLLQFPFDVTTLFESLPEQKTVKILGQNMDFTGISYFCNGYEVPKNITTSITWATFDIKERFGSFLDYTGTSIDLYMPFIGHINLTPPSVMGRRIKVVYDIDFGDGSVLGTVWATHNRNNWDNPEGSGYYPVCSQSGQIGTIVPLGSSDGLNKTQQKTTAVAGLLLGAGVTAATGGATAPLLVGAGLGTINNLSNMPSYQSGGVVESNHTFSVSTDCILTITFPEVDIPSNYAKIAGYPTNLYTKLKNLQGFTACDMVKINNINCTESEAAEIKNLLTQGVVIS